MKGSGMPKTIAMAILLLALVLGGCAVFGSSADRALRRSPSFKAGYSDGCAAATAPTSNPRDSRDTLAGEDKIYRRGYAMGYQSCHQKPPAYGAPTGGLPGQP
jgi:hypothetical protein